MFLHNTQHQAPPLPFSCFSFIPTTSQIDLISVIFDNSSCRMGISVIQLHNHCQPHNHCQFHLMHHTWWKQSPPQPEEPIYGVTGVTYCKKIKEETWNSRCKSSYLSPYLPQQTYTYHLNHLQHWRFNVLNIKIVQSIFGMINWIGEITDSCSLNAARYCLENAAGERFWDWMVVTQSLWKPFLMGRSCGHNSNKNSYFFYWNSYLVARAIFRTLNGFAQQ